MSRASFSCFNSSMATARSPSAEALASSSAAFCDFSSAISFSLAPVSDSRDCLSIAYECWAFSSALRRSLSWDSALSLKSSSTSTMPSLWPWYAGAAGAPSSAPSLEEPEASCTSASSFCRSALVKDAALTTAVNDCSTLSRDPPLICMRAEGLLPASRSMICRARPSVSIVSMSSFSPVVKSLASLFRSSVAFFKSASLEAEAAPSSSIFIVDASTSAASLAI
mmetsp:Transcript_13842/g.41315  ORF Transcript_13842/g.41315 Transcript_13842/m.41315 type:complete len:224 (-) Transcript_13842:308-979(-)